MKLSDRWKYGDTLGKPLSPTQQKLLELVVNGTGIKQAAALLGMERTTADTQLSRAKVKLGAKTRYQAIALFTMQKVKEQI